MTELESPTALAAAVDDEESAASLPVWPMAVGVVAAGVASNILCSWLRTGSLPPFGLFVIALSLLFSAAMACGFVVRAIYVRMLHGKQKVATPVVRAACLTSLWIPAWMLFIETSSLLMIAAGALCLACLGLFLKRCEIDPAPDGIDAARPAPGTPFLFPDGLLARKLLPSLWLVLLFDGVIALAATRWFVMSSLAAGIFAAILAWRATARTRAGVSATGILPRSRQAVIATAAFALTVVALIPYLRVGILGGLRSPMTQRTPPKDGAAISGDLSSKGYIGIILLPPPTTQKKIVVPAHRELIPHFGVKISDPLEIPFDGQYWYFKWPDKRPRPNARVVRASSTKTQISSSTRTPLLMEAHQKLADAIDLGCCSAMNLVVENADQYGGAISMELWVRKLPEAKAAAKQRVNAVAPEQAPHYLGTEIIPSSQLPIAQRPNASGKTMEETLNFPIPAGMTGTLFDEITVVVKTAPERGRMGAKVAIKKFVLEP